MLAIPRRLPSCTSANHVLQKGSNLCFSTSQLTCAKLDVDFYFDTVSFEVLNRYKDRWDHAKKRIYWDTFALPQGGSSLSSTSLSSLVAWHQQQPTPTSKPWQNALTRQLTNSWIWRPEQQSNFIIHCLGNIFFFYLDSSTSHSRWRLIRSTWSEWLALYSSKGSSPLSCRWTIVLVRSE